MTRLIKPRSLSFALLAMLSACASTPPSPEHFDAIGVKNGASIFEVQGKLAQEGFNCYVSGAKRENFTCSKMGASNLGLATCVAHVEFQANDKNEVENFVVPQAACSGL